MIYESTCLQNLCLAWMRPMSLASSLDRSLICLIDWICYYYYFILLLFLLHIAQLMVAVLIPDLYLCSFFCLLCLAFILFLCEVFVLLFSPSLHADEWMSLDTFELHLTEYCYLIKLINYVITLSQVNYFLLVFHFILQNFLN